MGGAESLIAQIVPLMQNKGFKVDVALFDGHETPLKQKLIAAGVSIYDFSNGGNVYNPLNIFRLIRLMRKYDIVHTHNTAPQLFAAIGSVLCSVVLVTTEHNTSNRRRNWKWYSAIDRWMYGRYSHIICISKKAEYNLRESISSKSDNISTINNGIDTTAFNSALPAAYIREGLPVNVKLITMVAGFRWEKDQPTLINALKFLPENFHLMLVGVGVRQDECRKLAEKIGVNNRTHFLGLRTDVPSVLMASDYIAMSSHFEGLSLSSLEGMSVGKPFLASDVDGLREVVSGAGILFPHEDHETFASEIMHLDSDAGYAKSISERCVKRASEYDIKKMVDGYISVYQQIINKK